jgi:hypothetical protein
MSAKEANQEYLDRKARRSHPDGKFDSGGRWYPSDDETQACCHKIRNPSRAWPWSLMHHCRTEKHVANLHGVTVTEMRKAAKSQ